MNLLDDIIKEYQELLLQEDDTTQQQAPDNQNDTQSTDVLDPNEDSPVDVSNDNTIQNAQFDNIETLHRINALSAINNLWYLVNKLKYVSNINLDKNLLVLTNSLKVLSDKLDLFSTEDIIKFKNNFIKLIEKNLSQTRKSYQKVKESNNNLSILPRLHEFLLENTFDFDSVSIEHNRAIVKDLEENQNTHIKNLFFLLDRAIYDLYKKESNIIDIYSMRYTKVELLPLLNKAFSNFKNSKINIKISNCNEVYFNERLSFTQSQGVTLITDTPIDIDSTHNNHITIKSMPINENDGIVFLIHCYILNEIKNKNTKLYKELFQLHQVFLNNLIQIFLDKVFNINKDTTLKYLNHLTNNFKIDLYNQVTSEDFKQNVNEIQEDSNDLSAHIHAMLKYLDDSNTNEKPIYSNKLILDIYKEAYFNTLKNTKFNSNSCIYTMNTIIYNREVFIKNVLLSNLHVLY